MDEQRQKLIDLINEYEQVFVPKLDNLNKYTLKQLQAIQKQGEDLIKNLFTENQEYDNICKDKTIEMQQNLIDLLTMAQEKNYRYRVFNEHAKIKIYKKIPEDQIDEVRQQIQKQVDEYRQQQKEKEQQQEQEQKDLKEDDQKN